MIALMVMMGVVLGMIVLVGFISHQKGALSSDLERALRNLDGSPSSSPRPKPVPLQLQSTARGEEKRTAVIGGLEIPIVPRTHRPYWEERGWKRSSNGFTGYFRSRFGSWRGKAEVSASGKVKMFIHKPPEALERHSHWACFMPHKNDWYFIHTQGRLKDLSAGILAVEKILNEAFRR